MTFSYQIRTVAIMYIACLIASISYASSEISLSDQDMRWWDPADNSLILTATGGNESSLEETMIGGRKAWKSKNPNTYFYFAINNNILYNIDADVILKITYYDAKDANFRVEYDSADTSYAVRGAFKDLPFFDCGGTNTWKEQSFTLNRARFANRQNNNSDFRILAFKSSEVYINKISLSWNDSEIKKFERPKPKSAIWMGPLFTGGGRDDIAKFFEKPDEWAQTRSMITGMLLSDLVLDRFSDDQLKQWLPMFKSWNIKMGLEVGAIKEWAVTGDEGFKAGKVRWDRFQSLGGQISRFGMDEPFYCADKVLKKSFDYTVAETAKFVASIQ